MVCLGEEGEEAGGCFWWEGEVYFTFYIVMDIIIYKIVSKLKILITKSNIFTNTI